MRSFNAIIFLLLLFITSTGIAQDTLDMKEIYIDNELVYKFSDDQRFTGVAQSKRKNGHLKYEEVYKDGVILIDFAYYNGKEKIISHKTIYNRYKLWVKEKEYFYDLKDKWYQTTSFDENGKIVLVEQFKKDKRLYYRCEYVNGKKHGKEVCFFEDKEDEVVQYLNGKKIKNKAKRRKK